MAVVCEDMELAAEIRRLCVERKAIILAHNYQRPEVQQIADYLGDSLELSIKASRLGEVEVVVFCSVDFMAETAKLLAPDKLVLLPDATPGARWRTWSPRKGCAR